MTDPADLFARIAQLEADVARWRAFVEQSADILVEVDAAARITYVSPAVTRVLGWRPDEIIGHTSLEFLHPDEQATGLARFQARLAGADLPPEVLRWRTRDGSWRWIAVNAASVTDADGSRRLLVDGRDVTEARATEQQFRTLFNRASDALILWAGTRFVDCNPAALELFGATSVDAMRGLTPVDLAADVQPTGAASAEQVDHRAKTVEVRGREAFEWLARRLDGTTFPAAVTLTTIDAGEQELVLAVVHDLTERKRTEAELRDARNRALEAAQARAEFLASMSHEIRTPLNAVIGYADLLLEMERTGQNDPVRTDFLGTIRRASGDLLELINAILDLSQLEAGKMPVVPRPTDLRDAVEDVVALLAPRAGAKGVELLLRWVPGTPEGVVADAMRIRQIVTNLVGNAIKFTERGRVTVEVHADAPTADRAVLHLSVQDTGIGIPADRLDRIFAKYEQAEEGTAARFGGTGLGLSIVQQLAGLMGGDVQVTSVVGEGSRFVVTIPMALAPVAAPAPIVVPPGGRGHVGLLCVEPHRAAILREQLEAVGFTVDEPHDVPAFATVGPMVACVIGWEALGQVPPLPPGTIRALLVPREHFESAQGLLGVRADVLLLAPLLRRGVRELVTLVDGRVG
ncbi:MAG TPA: PAS domain S-box protein [Gemmatimonadales bacterium]|nr:PAS domain S-box protein [Gemmatimonadales bacterium]